MDTVIRRLLDSEEPAVRYKVMVNVLGRNPEAAECRGLRQAIKESPRAQTLLAEVAPPSNLDPGPYRKWTGAHWVLADLADIGYPPDDEALIPLRGLALHARLTGDTASRAAAERAAEIFLKRRLFRRQTDGSVIDEDFVRLHYPCYWRYDILFGLKVMAEAGFIGDERCREALDLLETKRLPDGGFPAEKKYYRVTDKRVSGRSRVNWGGTSKKRMNAFVTADALYVLSVAGRLKTSVQDGSTT